MTSESKFVILITVSNKEDVISLKYKDKIWKKVKKSVDTRNNKWYIINALEKSAKEKKMFFENWAKCQFLIARIK